MAKRRQNEPVGLDQVVTPWTARLLQQESDKPMVGPPYHVLLAEPRPVAAYQFKLKLRDIRPMIWRRFVVPNHLTFAAFSDVILAVMGWMNCHLHEFHVGRGRIGVPDSDGYEPMLAEDKYRLCDVQVAALRRLTYLYDFGDSWLHSLSLEKTLPAESFPRPHCVEGARACPPEDCGGTTGYAHLVKVLRKPSHPEHEEMRMWAGHNYDPDFFDVRGVNRNLNRRKRRG